MTLDFKPERKKRYPILGSYIPFIDKWLEQDLKEPRKQRHIAKSIYVRLQKESHYKYGRLTSELWSEEKTELLTPPQNEYEIFHIETAQINNYGCVVIDTHHFGGSPELAGECASLKIFYGKIEIYYEHTLLKAYSRNYGRNKEFFNWKQYIGLMREKPSGVILTRFFESVI